MVQLHGTTNWSMVSQSGFNGKRSGKQCRERFLNHLSPEIQKRPWTKEDDDLLFDLNKRHGNKWSDIGKILNRSDLSVKNRYYSTLRKLKRHNKKKKSMSSSTVASSSSSDDDDNISVGSK